MTILATALATATAALLVWGALTDVRTAKIPNRLTLAGLVLAPLAALFAGGMSALGFALAAAAVAFVIGFAGFALGAIGGGDAKFLMVGAAVVGFHDLLPFLLAAGALGGVLALAYVLFRGKGLETTVRTLDLGMAVFTLGRKGHRNQVARRAKDSSEKDPYAVPYGVAIAASALLVAFTPFAEWLLP
jgi:Flp pilus assembly protein protease CpaA